MVIGVTLQFLSQRGAVADSASVLRITVPLPALPILIAPADLSRTPSMGTPLANLERAARECGRRGVTYGTRMAFRRLARRRRPGAMACPGSGGVARRRPSGRAVAGRLERRCVARNGTFRRLAGGFGRARVLDVQASRRRRVTAPGRWRST